MMEAKQAVELNDTVWYVGNEPPPHPLTRYDEGSVIWIFPEFADWGDPKTHLVRFEFDGDLDKELHWFDPADLQVVKGRNS